MIEKTFTTEDKLRFHPSYFSIEYLCSKYSTSNFCESLTLGPIIPTNITQ